MLTEVGRTRGGTAVPKPPPDSPPRSKSSASIDPQYEDWLVP
jgi:hypothetical protein